MPDDSKNNLNSFIMGILLILSTLVINGIVSGKNADQATIENAASKDDLTCVKNEMITYTDKGDALVVNYVDVRMKSEEKLRDTQYTTIIGMLQSLIDKEK